MTPSASCAGSACGKALGALPSTTVGYERLHAWWAPYLASGDEQGFVDELLDGQPDTDEVVAYCRGPYCVYADDAVRRLREQGREAVRLEDGFPEWREAGGPVEA